MSGAELCFLSVGHSTQTLLSGWPIADGRRMFCGVDEHLNSGSIGAWRVPRIQEYPTPAIQRHFRTDGVGASFGVGDQRRQQPTRTARWPSSSCSSTSATASQGFSAAGATLIRVAFVLVIVGMALYRPMATRGPWSPTFPLPFWDKGALSADAESKLRTASLVAATTRMGRSE